MAAFDYAELQTVASQLIKDTGRQIKVQKMAATAADPTKPWKGPDTPTVQTEVTCFATFVEVFSVKDLGIEIEDEELLKRTDKVVLVEHIGTDVRDFNRIVDGTVIYGIEWAQVLEPGPLTMFYWFGIKR